MTIYHRIGRKVEILGADLTDDNSTVWWAYAESEFEDLSAEHKGVHSDPLHQLVADDGTEEVMQAILELPENRVVGRKNVQAEMANVV